MGRFILIYGKSGSGKTRSLKNFGETEIFLVNVIGKELPFRNRFKYVSTTDSVDTIIAGLQRMPCKTAVIDDAGYLMTSQFMAGHNQPKKGSSSFDLYNDIADSIWKLIRAIKDLPEDVNVYMILHEETNDYGDTRLRTIGNGSDITKSPEDMFDGERIDNDLKAVDERIREFYSGN